MGNTEEKAELNYKRLPDAEFEIMKIIWAASGPVTSSDVMDRIRPRGRWANTTVLNFLGRLVEKGFVRTRKQGKCNIYSAVADETVYLQQEGNVMLNRLFNGSVTALISALYDSHAIDDDDLAELNEYIASRIGVVSTDDVREPDDGNRWKSWYRRHFKFD